MELYEYARPDLMDGKKLLFLHGFASSGQNGSVKTLRTLLPKTEIIAPDLAVEPAEAMGSLKKLCGSEKPDLIIGTSMGGMYAELMEGFWKILVNPAFQLADTILKNNGLGKQEFHNPRKDGQTSFLVTKALLEEFRECSAGCFGHSAEDNGKVYGLFGTHDTLVPGGFELFSRHYTNAIRFNGEHNMNDSAILHSVLPVIQRIDDLQEGRSRKTVMISVTDTLADSANEKAKGKKYTEYEAKNSAYKAFCKLSESYDCHILESMPYNSPDTWGEVVEWAESHIGVPAWNKVTVSPRKDLILGDYLIDAHADENGADNFMGTVIKFGEEPFKNWDEVLEYFGRLGGQ